MPDWGWALLLSLLGGILRWYKIGANSLWVDEFATLKIVTLPFAEILRAAAEVNFCPPLHFWLVNGVVSVLGVSETSLRLVSAVAGTLTIPVAWLLIRELTRSRTVALVSTALLAVNPLHIWYSQEARAYALLVLLGTSALLFLLLATRTGALRDWAGFVCCTAGTVLTHTIGPLFLMVAWGWALLSSRRGALLRPLLLSSIAVGLIAAPFALVIAGAVAHATGTHSPDRPLTGLEIPYTLLTYLVGYSFGPSTREIQNLGPVTALRLHSLESGLSAAVMAGLLFLMLSRRAPGRMPLLMLCIVPIVAMLLGSATSGKAYQARYALAGLVGFCGLAAGGLHRLSTRFRAPVTAAVLTLCVWADAQWYFTPRYWKDDSRAVVAWLAELVPEGSTVLTAPDYVTGVLSYYAHLQAAPVHVVGVDAAAWDSVTPAALLMTRLHHVPDPQSLRERFRELAGPGVREDTVGGYQILMRTDKTAQPPRR
jgi:mannosyltransferase